MKMLGQLAKEQYARTMLYGRLLMLVPGLLLLAAWAILPASRSSTEKVAPRIASPADQAVREALATLIVDVRHAMLGVSECPMYMRDGSRHTLSHYAGVMGEKDDLQRRDAVLLIRAARVAIDLYAACIRTGVDLHHDGVGHGAGGVQATYANTLAVFERRYDDALDCWRALPGERPSIAVFEPFPNPVGEPSAIQPTSASASQPAEAP